MNRYSVSNEDETVTIEVWAFDQAHALERVEKLTDSQEFKRVKHVNVTKLCDTDDLVDSVLN